uniref:Uncharacterized protein n=1 Tax=Sphaerodactylus townsendi TaxID=933632 RepID=A0ACB8ELY8_9SAUR
MFKGCSPTRNPILLDIEIKISSPRFQDVDATFRYQKELELKRELLKENIDFLRIFCAEELAALNRQLYDTSVVLNMNNSRRLNMDGLIQSIECWYQTIAQKSKEEANLFYQNQIQNLQNKNCQFHESLKRNHGDITELNRMIPILQCQVDNEKKKVGGSLARVNLGCLYCGPFEICAFAI